jgi:hypothetical protein
VSRGLLQGFSAARFWNSHMWQGGNGVSAVPEQLVAVQPRAAVACLRAIGPAPWEVIAGGRLRMFGEKQLEAMVKWINHAASQQVSTYAGLPVRDGHTRHIAIRAPRSVRPGGLRLAPSLIVTAEQHWLVWTLNDEVPLAEARRLAIILARQCDGVPAVGEAIPLPGTIRYAQTGVGLRARHNVTLLPPNERAYRIVGGELAAVEVDKAAPASPFMAAHEMKPDAVEWLWPGLVPYRSATLLGGRPGFGKSMIAVGAAAIVSSGGTWPGGERAERGSVLVIEMEDDPERTTLPRFLAAGGDPRKAGIGDALDLSRGGLVFLEAERQRRGDLKLVVLSPIRKCVGDADAAGNIPVRNALQPFAAWLRQHRIACLAVLHPVKGQENKPDVFSGSAAYVEVCRSALVAMPDPASRERDVRRRSRVFGNTKGNLGPDDLLFGYQIEGVTAAGIATARVIWS